MSAWLDFRQQQQNTWTLVVKTALGKILFQVDEMRGVFSAILNKSPIGVQRPPLKLTRVTRLQC